jgi:exodeoxyribonuclease VII small subunit
MSKNLKFEESMVKLEKIVEQMETGDLELEKSLELFEEGIRLVRLCSSKLEETKKKVEILVKKNGKITAQPFKEEQDNENKLSDNDLFK